MQIKIGSWLCNKFEWKKKPCIYLFIFTQHKCRWHGESTVSHTFMNWTTENLKACPSSRSVAAVYSTDPTQQQRRPQLKAPSVQASPRICFPSLRHAVRLLMQQIPAHLKLQWVRKDIWETNIILLLLLGPEATLPLYQIIFLSMNFKLLCSYIWWINWLLNTMFFG